MAVPTPLATRPIPPYSNIARALYVWTGASVDPLDTDDDQQELIAFCGTKYVNTLFLDMYSYLGGANWTAPKVARVQQFIEAAHLSGVRVYALAGDTNYANAHQWVMVNVVNPVLQYNAMSTSLQRFDGWHFDIEYWAVSDNYGSNRRNLVGLCDLLYAVKARDPSLAVSAFAAFFLKDASGARESVIYRGKEGQDGEHLIDAADFLVIGAYRDTAAGQIELFTPWFVQAQERGVNKGLFCGSETKNTIASITFYGGTRAAMESVHAAVSSRFRQDANAAFLGQAIHAYSSYKVMS